MPPSPERDAAIDENPQEDVELKSILPGLSRELGKLLALLVVALGVFALLYLTPVGSLVGDIQQLRTVLDGDDLWAETTFLGLVVGLIALGMPRLMFYALGGLAFGFWEGFLLAQVGALAGSYLTFRAVRAGGRGWLMSRYGNHRFVSQILKVRSSIKSIILIRQLPISSVMINSGLALSQISDQVFLLGSFIGFLPQGVIACLIASGIADAQALEGLGKLIGAGVVLVAGILLLRHWKSRKASAFLS